MSTHQPLSTLCKPHDAVGWLAVSGVMGRDTNDRFGVPWSAHRALAALYSHTRAMITACRRSHRWLICLLSVHLTLVAADPSASAMAAAKAPENGLVVQVGASNASFLHDLTLGGKRLVQGLVFEDATRTSLLPELIATGAHPYATVAVWHGAPLLPYADRLVTLLIVDRDDLGIRAPAPSECQRVVQPGGIILERIKNIWSATVVSRPVGLGDWTHFDGGPEGNAVSSDQEATAIRGLQWIDNVREVRWAKSGPHGGEGGNIRILGRYAVIDARIYPEDKDPKFEKRMLLECRDVYNGLLIWQRSRASTISGKRWSLAVGEGQAFTWLAENGALTALDLATGLALRTYPGSEIKPYLQEEHGGSNLPKPRPSMFGDSHWVRIAGATVLANGDGALRAWTMDGKPMWTFRREGFRLETPVVDTRRNLAYGFLVPDQLVNRWGKGPVLWQRWSTSEQIQSVIAINLTNGNISWENRDVASRDTDIMLHEKKEPRRIGFGQLLVSDEHVIAFNSSAISGGQMPLIASIDAVSGKTAHFDPKLFVYTNNHGRVLVPEGAYCAVARDGLVYVMGGFSIRSFNPKTGILKEELSVSWNARCHKPIATTTHFLLGQTAFIDKDFAGEMFSVARSGCAHSPVPGSGVIMFGPHTCACTTHFDGFLATTSRAAPAPVADRQRLVPLKAAAFTVPVAKPAVAESLVSQSWSWFTISEPVAPAAVDASGWVFQITPQAHRLDARKGSTAWTFVGDARLAESFCVVGDRVIVGSHDGWVYGLDLATGARRWRNFVAPAFRQIIANGMLTSAWPVMGVADLGNGQIVASAGTHLEMEGGIRVVALAAADGTQAWVKQLRKTSSTIPAGGKQAKIVDRSLINAAPRVENGKIVIDGGSHLGHLEFTPDESAESISLRLSSPAKKSR